MNLTSCLPAALLAAAVPFAVFAQTSSAPAVAVDLVGRYAAMKNAHDASRMAEIYADDYVEHSGRNPSGLAAAAQNWKSQFAAIPDVSVEVHDVIAGGDRIVARTTYSGTHTTPFFAGIAPTGRRFSFGTIDIWRVQGGKLAEHWDQVDFAGLQRQLAAAAKAEPK